MSVNLKISFNNNFITNSSYTKFLGVKMNNTLSWNNRIDLLMKKLRTACHIIRNAKTYLFALSLKMIYYAHFTWL
jgi:N-glycosylase/DNA lyase